MMVYILNALWLVAQLRTGTCRYLHAILMVGALLKYPSLKRVITSMLIYGILMINLSLKFTRYLIYMSVIQRCKLLQRHIDCGTMCPSEEPPEVPYYCTVGRSSVFVTSSQSRSSWSVIRGVIVIRVQQFISAQNARTRGSESIRLRLAGAFSSALSLGERPGFTNTARSDLSSARRGQCCFVLLTLWTGKNVQ
jgi:hypothetical protein